MKINRATPYLRVSNCARSVAFYRDLLGFKVTASIEHEGEVAWAYLQSDGCELMVSYYPASSLPHAEDDEHEHQPWRGPGQESGVDIHTATWLYVDDADAEYERLSSARADVVDVPRDKPYGLREFCLRDPDGYYHVIAHPIPAPHSRS